MARNETYGNSGRHVIGEINHAIGRYVQRPGMAEITQALGPVNAGTVALLSEILERPLFRDQKHIDIAHIDLDGVVVALTNRYARDTFDERIATLKAIAPQMDMMVFWTGRMATPDLDDSPRLSPLAERVLYDRESVLSRFPFLTDGSMRWLYNTFTQAGAGDVVIQVGMDKVMRGKNHLIDRTGKILQQGGTGVYIGSSLFDLRRTQEFVRHSRAEHIPLGNFHYFTTGRILY